MTKREKLEEILQGGNVSKTDFGKDVRCYWATLLKDGTFDVSMSKMDGSSEQIKGVKDLAEIKERIHPDSKSWSIVNNIQPA